MPKNLFQGFRLFIEEDDHKPDSYVATAKKQLGVAKKLWMGMPVLISNTKLGNHMITDPTMFYVTDFDETSVTLTNVPKPGSVDDTDDSEPEEDTDDEIDLDRETVRGRLEVTIDRNEFWKLQEPQVPPGMDPSSMGGMGGMGGPL